MLRGIRKASENWLGRAAMAVVLSLLAGSFAVWGINDIFRGFGRSTLASIGSTEISIDTFRQTYNERLQELAQRVGHPIPPEQASAIVAHQVLGEMIAQAGLDERARQMGLGVSEAEIARHITTDPHMLGANGQFDRARFDMLLRTIGYSEQRFVAEQRQSMLRRELIDSVAGDVAAPKAWLDAINQFQNEERSFRYVVLGPAQAGDVAAPTDEQLTKYFDERKILFRAPEFRKIDTVTVTPASLAQWMAVSDEDIKKAYDARQASFVTPERRHIEQILFPTMADAEAAADRIKSGTSFADVAAARGLKPADIDLGTVTKSAIVEPAAADAAFALKEGEVSAPIQTRFGAALVTVLAIQPSTTQSLAEATPALREAIALDRAKAQLRDIHDKIEDDRAGGASLQEAAAKEKLPVVSFDVDRSGRDADGKVVVNVPHGAEVVAAAFNSDVGIDNDPIEAEGGYVWYDVAAVTPARDRRLDEVKAQVTQSWRDDEIAARLKAKAADILDKLKAGNAFEAIAAADGLKIETATDLKRGGVSGALTPRMTEALFRTPKDGFGSSAGDKPTQWVVFQVTGDKTPEVVANSPDLKRIDETVQHQIADDMTGQYLGWLEDNLGTKVNAAALTQAVGGNAPDTD